MKLKKLLPELVDTIHKMQFDPNFNEIQGKIISTVKSGADGLIIAPNGEGKTVALAIALVQQLKSAFEMAPRAIVVVESKDKAFEFDELFESLAKNTSLRSLLVYDEGNLAYQKDMIYEGIDLLISTPKRLLELMNNSGVPLVQLKMLVVDDGETLFKAQNHTLIHRIVDSVGKVQVIVSANESHSKFDDLAERAMKGPQVISK